MSDDEIETIVEWRPPCEVCTHYSLGQCQAFPGGIPQDVWSGSDMHIERRGDQAGAHVLEFGSEMMRNYAIESRLLTLSQANRVKTSSELKHKT